LISSSSHRVDDLLGGGDEGAGQPGVAVLAALGADVVDERPQLADAVGRIARGEIGDGGQEKKTEKKTGRVLFSFAPSCRNGPW
jgi:hypothetical protein